jgi:glycosyltransferase involved in cell wall biosynthesis
MRVEAVILSYKNFQRTTKLCLDTIIPQIKNTSIRLSVFDNASPDNTQEELKIYHNQNNQNNQFNLILNSENLGFAGGFNKIFKNLDADWYLLIDSDAAFPKGSIASMLEALTKAKENEKIIGPITNNAGTCQHVIFEATDMIEIFNESHKLVSSGADFLIPIYRADFFCVAIRSDLWEKLNGLSEEYGRGYFEDFDFCMRAKNLGYQSYIFEKWFVYHQGSAVFKLDSSQKELIRKNRNIFVLNFPHAELRHRREDIFHLISIYKKNRIIESNIYKNRIKYLLNDVPRSFFKRLIWKKKLRQYIHPM